MHRLADLSPEINSPTWRPWLLLLVHKRVVAKNVNCSAINQMQWHNNKKANRFLQKYTSVRWSRLPVQHSCSRLKTKDLNIILYSGKLGKNIFVKSGSGLAIKCGLFCMWFLHCPLNVQMENKLLPSSLEAAVHVVLAIQILLRLYRDPWTLDAHSFLWMQEIVDNCQGTHNCWIGSTQPASPFVVSL